jgi:hypothetical protein
MIKAFRASTALAFGAVFLPLIAFAQPAHSLQARFIDQLKPIGLPSGVLFGGGGNSFERRVDVSGSIGVVGAGIFRSGADQGLAFVYDFSDPKNIQQIASLRASDNSAGNEYGDGVAVSGNYVFVTAWGDSSYRGAVYMYDVTDPANLSV